LDAVIAAHAAELRDDLIGYDSDRPTRSLRVAYRIHRSMNGENVVFSLSGTMDGEHVTDLRGLLTAEPNRRVHLDLKDVTLVNHGAVVFLARAEAEGVMLVNCPDYVRSWITAEQRAAH
jgi:hypothetical protein